LAGLHLGKYTRFDTKLGSNLVYVPNFIHVSIKLSWLGLQTKLD